MLERGAFRELIDPRLGGEYSEHQVQFMLHAASLCLGRDPHARPRMSQVIIIKKIYILKSNIQYPIFVKDLFISIGAPDT